MAAESPKRMVIPNNVSMTTVTVTVSVLVFGVTFSMKHNFIQCHDDLQNLATCVHDNIICILWQYIMAHDHL